MNLSSHPLEEMPVSKKHTNNKLPNSAQPNERNNQPPSLIGLNNRHNNEEVKKLV